MEQYGGDAHGEDILYVRRLRAGRIDVCFA